MTRLAWFSAIMSAGVVASGGATGFGQTPAVPSPPRPGGGTVSADLDQPARKMAEELRSLGEAIANDLGATPRGRALNEEAKELALAVREFHDSLRPQSDRFQTRQTFSGIDSSWHNLMSRISQPGSSSPGVDKAVQRVSESAVLIRRALGLNDYPVGFYNGSRPLSGMAELQRLTHALVDRAEALVAAIRVEYANAGAVGGRLIQNAVNLAAAADNYHDALKIGNPIEATAQNGFAGVEGLADHLQAELAQTQLTPRVRNAWLAYHSAEVLTRRALGLPTDPEKLAETVLMDMPGGGSPITEKSDLLVKQVTDFVRVFSQTGGAVPQGGQFLADAQTLQTAATNFRLNAARGMTPARLAFEFRDVDAIWQRLARRTNRIARGRTGPNIQQVGLMGQTIAEIHRLLAMPGYAPVVGPP